MYRKVSVFFFEKARPVYAHFLLLYVPFHHQWGEAFRLVPFFTLYVQCVLIFIVLSVCIYYFFVVPYLFSTETTFKKTVYFSQLCSAVVSDLRFYKFH